MSGGGVETPQCADVRTLGNAHSHITQGDRTLDRTTPAQPSLKSLAGAVLGRTSSAHCADELDRLVVACGDAYGFTEAEHAEALAAARADPDAALLCYTTIAIELELHRGTRSADQGAATNIY